MALRDLLAGEDADLRQATDAATHGRSLTGFSGRHSETTDRFAAGDAMFGGEATRAPEPIVGERVGPIRVGSLGGQTALDQLIGNDPLFRQSPSMTGPEREPFGTQEQSLAYPERPGYRRYWANDLPGRIARFKKAGYSHVIDPDTGQPVSQITDKADGRGRSSYLMEIPMQWYQEDMARAAAILEGRLQSIRQGTAGPGAQDNRYVPKQGISITRR